MSLAEQNVFHPKQNKRSLMVNICEHDDHPTRGLWVVFPNHRQDVALKAGEDVLDSLWELGRLDGATF